MGENPALRQRPWYSAPLLMNAKSSKHMAYSSGEQKQQQEGRQFSFKQILLFAGTWEAGPGNPGIALEPCERRAEVVANLWLFLRTVIGEEDALALCDQVIGSAGRQRLNREPGVCRSLRGQNAAVAYKQIRNIMRAAKLVHDRRFRVFAHARGTHQVCIARLLYDVLGTGGPQHFGHFVFSELNQFFIVLMQVEGDFGHWQTVLV